jgi:putative transposase
MKNSKFIELQIIKILSEQNSGKTVTEICRKHKISQSTFFKWKKKYALTNSLQPNKFKEMEKELAQYKKIVAELTLANVVLKDVIEKKSNIIL